MRSTGKFAAVPSTRACGGQRITRTAIDRNAADKNWDLLGANRTSTKKAATETFPRSVAAKVQSKWSTSIPRTRKNRTSKTKTKSELTAASARRYCGVARDSQARAAVRPRRF